jgi:hypothetical protein
MPQYFLSKRPVTQTSSPFSSYSTEMTCEGLQLRINLANKLHGEIHVDASNLTAITNLVRNFIMTGVIARPEVNIHAECDLVAYNNVRFPVCVSTPPNVQPAATLHRVTFASDHIDFHIENISSKFSDKFTQCMKTLGVEQQVRSVFQSRL